MPDGSQISTQSFVATKRRPSRRPARHKSLATLVKDCLAADRAWGDAYERVEEDEHRVKDLYPPCPETIWVATAYRHNPPSVHEQITEAINRGTIRGEEASKMIATFEEWVRQREAIDAKYLNQALKEEEASAQRAYEALKEQVEKAPVITTADVMAKLQFIDREYAHFCMTAEEAAQILSSLVRSVSPGFRDIEISEPAS